MHTYISYGPKHLGGLTPLICNLNLGRIWEGTGVSTIWPTLAHESPQYSSPSACQAKRQQLSPTPLRPQGPLRQSLDFSGMAASESDDEQYRSIDCGVVPCGLEEAMVVRIALPRSREDGTRPTAGSVWREAIAIASAHWALRSSGAGSLRSSR